jgi:hypothetical protein
MISIASVYTAGWKINPANRRGVIVTCASYKSESMVVISGAFD